MFKRVLAYFVALIVIAGLLAGCENGPTELECPQEVNVEVNGIHSLRVTWDEVENATGYLVAIFKPETPENETVIQVKKEREAVFSGLEADTEFDVNVTSLYENGNYKIKSNPSEAVRIKTAGPEVGEAEGLSVEAVSEQELLVSWDPYQTDQTSADGSQAKVLYTLYASESSEGPYTVLAERIGETSYRHTGLDEQTTRYDKISVMITIDEKSFSGVQSTQAVSGITNAAPQQPQTPAVQQTAGTTGQSSTTGSGTVSNTKKEQAMAVARQIADSIGPGTDLERVSQAAAVVRGYCDKAVYTTSGSDYCEAYGVFIAGEYSCAGATRALGMVLTCMGYEWEHVNENQWAHQWCRLVMDGKTGYADGQVGWAGYGLHPATGQ